MKTEKQSIENSNDDDYDVRHPIPVKRIRVSSKKQQISKQKPLKKSIADSELNITKDECSLYFIISHSKSSINVIYYFIESI